MKNSLSRQLSKVITFCCAMAVLIQGIVMTGMIVRQYVNKEREDILYLLKSNNEGMENRIQYLEEIIISIRHNPGLNDFLKGVDYNMEEVTKQLSNIVNIFSEINLVNGASPFIEKVYLYNYKQDNLSLIYYPVTMEEKEKDQKEYKELYKAFLESEEDFYYNADQEAVDLCIVLYDEKMQKMGGCIISLNKAGIENTYTELQKNEKYIWKIIGKNKVIMEKTGSVTPKQGPFISHTLKTDFGLWLYAAVPENVIFQSTGPGIVITVISSLLMIAILSYLGYIVSRRYIKPLETVAEKIKQVGKGDFQTKLDNYGIEELKNISETFNEMTDYINTLIKEVYETKLLAQQAQIKYLQAQINPHFMFNVLSMIEMKAALKGDKEVQQMIYKLSKLYQGKIFRKNEVVIRLSEEMEITEFYLSLQNSRFGEKVKYLIEYEGDKKEYEGLRVPRLCIEPIVENAVCHGLEPKEKNGNIAIKVSKNIKELKIVVEDDGVGFQVEESWNQSNDLSQERVLGEENKNKNHNHVGLWNTNKMIQNLYGKEYGLKIKSEPGAGTKVIILLPVRREDE